jgi:hypothetical protein
MRFADIVTRVKALTNVSSQDDLIKDSIIMGLDRATGQDLPYLMTDGFITTVAPYETGTVDVTNNSATVTGNSTVWTSAMVGRKIRVAGENAYYRIKTVGSTTSITLEVPYQGTTKTLALGTNPTYSIYKDEYKLPADCDTYKVLRQIENARSMISLEATAFDIVEPAPEATGSPAFEIMIGTRLDVYTTGTISGTINTSTITGASTLWTSVEGLGKGSKITIGSYVYTVKSVDSDTQITIYEKQVVTSAVLTTYIVSLDNMVLQFFNIPDSIENIYFRYQRTAFPLVNDQDIPDLPDKYHWILVHAGSIWAWLTKDKARSDIEQTIFEAAIQQMWRRIGYPSVSRVYPRISQDDINERNQLGGSGTMPSGYGVPIPR